jgi:hypothetical protein
MLAGNARGDVAKSLKVYQGGNQERFCRPLPYHLGTAPFAWYLDIIPTKFTQRGK